MCATLIVSGVEFQSLHDAYLIRSIVSPLLASQLNLPTKDVTPSTTAWYHNLSEITDIVTQRPRSTKDKKSSCFYCLALLKNY